MVVTKAANKITGAITGGPRRLPMRTHWAARIAQFRRSAMRAQLTVLGNLVFVAVVSGCATTPAFAPHGAQESARTTSTTQTQPSPAGDERDRQVLECLGVYLLSGSGVSNDHDQCLWFSGRARIERRPALSQAWRYFIRTCERGLAGRQRASGICFGRYAFRFDTTKSPSQRARSAGISALDFGPARGHGRGVRHAGWPRLTPGL